ncbi:MAG: LysM peptidoglycan-binding domain-containing protein, partial [Hyphomicrobiales bacterium]|nr:LysM peptidoglycan-binding domain-containing protein [Hyphomicrobiales bacterium]
DSRSNATQSAKEPPAPPAAIIPKPGSVPTKQAAGIPAAAPAKAPEKEPARRSTVVAAAPEPAAAPAASQPAASQLAERQVPEATPVPSDRASEAKQPVPVAREQQPEPVKQQPQAVASAATEPAPKPGPVKVEILQQKRSILVRRGDTLWHIARRRYGRGIRYTAIYRNNRDQIRNPHLIYPGQEFRLPTR